MRDQEFSARWTVDRKARRVGVSQGLLLDFLKESFVITGACLSSKDKRVVL